MREVNVAPPLEVQVMEDEGHDGYSHAKRGKEMGGDGSVNIRGSRLVVERAEIDEKNDVLDVEAWDKLREYGRNGLIL